MPSWPCFAICCGTDAPSWRACRAARPAMRPPPAPTPGDAWRNSHLDLSLQCYLPLSARPPWGFRRCHGLAVDDACAGRGLPALGPAQLSPQRGTDALPQTAVPPSPEVPVDQGSARQVVGQQPPRSTYRMAFTIARRGTSMGRPHAQGPGSKQRIRSHSASDRLVS